ncbi:hypothetical protein G7Y89_g11014 [Cudoniella acicularis]|uniref:Uncharacterized protein n=1 Tax=Cudoniella acicularis TaxID=354080 RepID=A0A8H4VYF9_9HELO|nr:hypothetical protein G7Y89_g11014 [Cudoniella acicularis]
MGCYSVLNSEDPKVFLKPAQNLLGIVRPQRLLGAPISDLTHLERHNLSSQFSYSRRLIKTKHFSGARPELTNLSQTDLFGTPQVFNAEDLQNVKIHNELAPLTLAVPYSPKVDTSIMSFGIATTADRIPDAIPNLLHWLPRTESSLHILVPPDQKISSLQQQMRDLQIKTTIKSTPHPFAKAYFSLIKELYDARTPKTKWLVLIDDDTFAPSLPALVSHLNQAYDANEQLILAAISDNMQQIHMFGLLPFGGGGIFVSVPLAAKLTEQKTD